MPNAGPLRHLSLARFGPASACLLDTPKGKEARPEAGVWLGGGSPPTTVVGALGRSYTPGMNNRAAAIGLLVLAVVFLVLNFTTNAGTIFLLLAVVSVALSVYLFRRPGTRA